MYQEIRGWEHGSTDKCKAPSSNPSTAKKKRKGEKKEMKAGIGG
jgi:hypothetical protein